MVQPMIHRSPSDASAAPFADQAKAATPLLKTNATLSMGLSRSKRVLGTRHLPALVWPC